MKVDDVHPFNKEKLIQHLDTTQFQTINQFKHIFHYIFMSMYSSRHLKIESLDMETLQQ